MKEIENYIKAEKALVDKALEILQSETQLVAAEKYGMAQSLISMIKKGDRKLTAEKAMLIIEKNHKL